MAKPSKPSAVDPADRLEQRAGLLVVSFMAVGVMGIVGGAGFLVKRFAEGASATQTSSAAPAPDASRDPCAGMIITTKGNNATVTPPPGCKLVVR